MRVDDDDDIQEYKKPWVGLTYEDQEEIVMSAHSIRDAIKPAIEIAVQKEREVVANWIMDRGFATGHGDSIVDLLDQLEWQIAEKEREACAKLLETTDLGGLKDNPAMQSWVAEILLAYAKAIRARGQA